MAKTFYTSGTGSQQTLTGSQDEKVAVYQTLADAEADLANLEAGQIVATPDTGDENAQPVDVVESGNMHAVTSNAVSGAISALDVSSVGGSGKYISAISETDGKISATATDLATSVASGNNAPVTSDAIYRLRRGLFYDTGLLELLDNQEKTVTLNPSRMYLFVNVHAVNGQELIILNCWNGFLRETRITHASDGRDTVITNSGQDVTFKSTTGCRGHLLYLTDYTTT